MSELAAARKEPAQPNQASAPQPDEAAALVQNWEIEVPLLRNRAMLTDLARVVGISTLLMAGLLSLMLWVNDDLEAIGPMLELCLVVGAGLGLLFLLIMGLVFGGHMRFAYRLDGRGIVCAVIDRRARAANRAALLAGSLSGRPGPAGIGLIASASESSRVAFVGSFRASFAPARHTITLRNSWRALMTVYCAPDNYEPVAAAIATALAATGSETRSTRSPLPAALARSALTVLACLPLFGLAAQFELSELAVLLVLCFGLATIWLVRFFGLAVLVGLVFLAAQLLLVALATQASWLEPGRSYAGFELWSDDDWALIALSVVAALLLAGGAIAALRGRLPAVLEQDAADAGVA